MDMEKNNQKGVEILLGIISIGGSICVLLMILNKCNCHL